MPGTVLVTECFLAPPLCPGGSAEAQVNEVPARQWLPTDLGNCSLQGSLSLSFYTSSTYFYAFPFLALKRNKWYKPPLENREITSSNSYNNLTTIGNWQKCKERSCLSCHLGVLTINQLKDKAGIWTQVLPLQIEYFLYYNMCVYDFNTDFLMPLSLVLF